MPYHEKEIEKRYFSMGEVTEQLQINASQIRYWETEFSELNPRKDPKGNRIFTKDDIEIVKQILYLTKDRGFTLEGAKAQLKSGNKKLKKNVEVLTTLKKLKGFLEELRETL